MAAAAAGALDQDLVQLVRDRLQVPTAAAGQLVFWTSTWSSLHCSGMPCFSLLRRRPHCPGLSSKTGPQPAPLIPLIRPVIIYPGPALLARSVGL